MLSESFGVCSEQLSECEIPFSEYEIPFSEYEIPFSEWHPTHDLSNTTSTILGATPGAIPGIDGNPHERFSFAPPFSERFFENWRGPRAQRLLLHTNCSVKLPLSRHFHVLSLIDFSKCWWAFSEQLEWRHLFCRL